jgi:oxygen-independent coproporphyrinogen-3 oxidase
VNRVSLGAQTFAPRLLDVLERVAGPDDIRCAVHTLRDALFDNISLDLIYGIPGQEPSDLDHDLAEALALAPEHLSLYELEAKPGTRFTHTWGDELGRQSEAMEGYFERVVETLTGAGYRWYETANFCLSGERADGRDLRAPQPGLLAGARLPRRRIGQTSVSCAAKSADRRYIAALAAGDEPPRSSKRSMLTSAERIARAPPRRPLSSPGSSPPCRCAREWSRWARLPELPAARYAHAHQRG